MKKYLWGFALALLAAGPLRADQKIRSINELLANGRFKQMVLIQGNITKAIDLDLYVLEDQTDHILINLERIKKKWKKGDSILCYGIYLGKVSHPSAKAQVNVHAVALTNDSAAVKALLDEYAGEVTPPTPPPAAELPAVKKSIESRLHELEELKSKGLITPDEYKEERKRILDSL